MHFIKWLFGDPVARGWVEGRAVAIPHYPSVETMSNSVENPTGADSISTLSVTVRPLKDGEFAEEVGAQYGRIAPTGVFPTTPVPEGCYRLHCNVPNWVRVLVKQEGYTLRLHTEVPIWVDPSTGVPKRINKEKLLSELMPEKDYASEAYDRGGYFLGP